VISGIHEPVRFLIEAKARVCVSNSKGDILSQDISDTIWSSFKKLTPFIEEFDMILKVYIYFVINQRQRFVFRQCLRVRHHHSKTIHTM
jgi:hypothetical protein